MLTKKELNDIKSRTENLYPAPWKWDSDKFGDLVIYSPDERGFHNNGGEIAELDYGMDDAAEFIAHAREDIPKLLKHIEELERKLTKSTEDNSHV